MPNVINLEERIRALQSSREIGNPSYETFLADEGLDLLAAFRAIGDADKRAALSRLVKSVSEGGELPSLACGSPEPKSPDL